jgi:hypothetical protein
MDEHRFDAMTKALGDGLTRRRVLGGITAGTLASVLGWRSTAAAQCAKEGQKPKDTKKGCCQGLVEDQNTGRCVAGAGFICPPGGGTSMCAQTPIWCLDQSGQPTVGTCAAHPTTGGTCACTRGPGEVRLPCTEENAAVVCAGAATCLPGDPVTGAPTGGHCGTASSVACNPANNDPTTGINPDCAFLATCSEGFCGGQACGNDADCGAGQVCISGAAFNGPIAGPCINVGNRCAPLCTV